MENANGLLLHPSMIGQIMSGVKKGWTVENSLTCCRALVQIHREIKWSRKADTGNKYTKKGLAVEEDGLTLYSQITGIYFKKNEIRLQNETFDGEIDTFVGEEILRAKHTKDIKCSWDWTTFPSMLDTKPDSDYEYQGQGYMDLSGAETHGVVYCLINTPDFLIKKCINDLFYQLGVEKNDPEFIEQCKKIETSKIVDLAKFKKDFPDYVFYAKDEDFFDIPAKERVVECTVKRDEKMIDSIKTRWQDCKIWMNNNLFIE